MEPIFTPEQLAGIKAYHLPYYIRNAVSPLMTVGFLALVLGPLNGPFFRLSRAVAAWLDGRFTFLRTAPGSRAFFRVMDKLWGEPGWGTAVFFALCVDLSFKLLLLPLDIYFGYILEHRYGMSAYTPLAYALDSLKGLLADTLATGSLVLGLYGLARFLPRRWRWWLVLGVPVSLLMLVSAALDPYRGRVYFDQAPLEAGTLRTRLTGLMARADITFADVVVEKTSVASKRVQAYFAGQGATRTIVLNDVMLKEFTEDEILAAVAHEAGHANESKWPGRIASSLAMVAFLFVIDWLLRLAATRSWFGATRFADIRTLPLLWLLLFIVMTASAPLSAAFSREREREADRYALRLTNDPATFRRMLVKAARVNKIDPEPPQWIVIKGMTHPPVGERIADISVP
jgi:STE24 endopeptidase